jgi:hypothetical protein
MPNSGSGAASGVVATVYSAYPATSDVVARLVAGGLAVSPEHADLLTAQLAASVREFERAVDLVPFLAPAGAYTRQLDPPIVRNGILILDRPLASLVSVAYQPIGDTSQTLVAADEYTPLPAAAPADGRPYTQIAFAAHRWPGPLGYPFRGSIYVNGRWGYSTTVPDDVWEAIAGRAAARAFPHVRTAQTGGVASVTRGAGEGQTETVSWGGVPPGILEEWKAAWSAAVAAYHDVGL